MLRKAFWVNFRINKTLGQEGTTICYCKLCWRTTEVLDLSPTLTERTPTIWACLKIQFQRCRAQTERLSWWFKTCSDSNSNSSSPIAHSTRQETRCQITMKSCNNINNLTRAPLISTQDQITQETLRIIWTQSPPLVINQDSKTIKLLPITISFWWVRTVYFQVKIIPSNSNISKDKRAQKLMTSRTSLAICWTKKTLQKVTLIFNSLDLKTTNENKWTNADIQNRIIIVFITLNESEISI